MNRKIKNILIKFIILAIISVIALSCLTACQDSFSGSQDEGTTDQTQNESGDQGDGSGDSDSNRQNREAITETGFSDAAYNVIYGVVTNVVSEDKVPQDKLNEIKDHCVQADILLKVYLTDNEDYIELRDSFTTNKSKYIAAMKRFYDGEQEDDDTNTIFSIINLYLSVMGKNDFSAFVYDMIKFSLDYTYKVMVKDDESLGITRSTTTEALADCNTFNTKVSLDEFTKFFTNSLLIFDILNENKSAEGTFQLYDAEIADMIKRPDFNVNIDEDGWAVILKQIFKLFSEESFMGLVYEDAHDSGDIDTFAAKMKNVVQFVVDVQGHIDEDAVNKLRSDKNEFIRHLVGEMSANASEWANVNEMLNISTKYDYNKTAVTYYKNDSDKKNEFENYKNNVTKHTVDDLKTATKETLPAVLEGIIASISPAFSFEADWTFLEEAESK